MIFWHFLCKYSAYMASLPIFWPAMTVPKLPSTLWGVPTLRRPEKADRQFSATSLNSKRRTKRKKQMKKKPKNVATNVILAKDVMKEVCLCFGTLLRQ